MGPNMDIVPMQNKRTAVVSPCAKFPVDTFLARFWNFPSKSIIEPIRLPNAILNINKTGYWLFGIAFAKLLIPNESAANPKPFIIVSWYSCLIPLCNVAPITLPANIVQQFVIVPSIIIPP